MLVTHGVMVCAMAQLQIPASDLSISCRARASRGRCDHCMELPLTWHASLLLCAQNVPELACMLGHAGDIGRCLQNNIQLPIAACLHSITAFTLVWRCSSNAVLVPAGYNVCIFAYGQTGSGKTHTMAGTDVQHEEGRGINYRALDDLFALHHKRSREVLTCSSL